MLALLPRVPRTNSRKLEWVAGVVEATHLLGKRRAVKGVRPGERRRGEEVRMVSGVLGVLGVGSGVGQGAVFEMREEAKGGSGKVGRQEWRREEWKGERGRGIISTSSPSTAQWWCGCVYHNMVNLP